MVQENTVAHVIIVVLNRATIVRMVAMEGVKKVAQAVVRVAVEDVVILAEILVQILVQELAEELVQAVMDVLEVAQENVTRDVQVVVMLKLMKH